MSGFLADSSAAIRADLAELGVAGGRSRAASAAACSVALAVVLAMSLRFDLPWWAGMGGFMSIQATQPASVARAGWRIVGTVFGAGIAYALVPWIVYDRPATIIVLFAIGTLGTLGALVSDHAYAWLFASITAGLVLTGSLIDPTQALHLAFYRCAEIAVGSASALIVVNVIGLPAGGATAAKPPGFHDLLGAQWPAMLHALRTGAAVALLPLVWIWLDLPGLSQVVVSAAALMAAPASAAGSETHREAIAVKALQRVTGCLLGGLAALAVLSLSLVHLLPWLAFLMGGIWIGGHVHFSQRSANYIGTQAVIVWIITLAQGYGPPNSILPGIDRFVAICGALILLWLLSLVMWPAAAPERAATN